MAWLHFVSYLFGGFLLYNAILHLTSSIMGHPFQNSTAHVVAVGAGFLLTGLFGARHFAHFHGGNSSEDSSAH